MDTSTIDADAVLRRAAWRLVPFILAMYIAAFLNRVNVGFAALTMNHDPGFSPEVYGWGTGKSEDEAEGVAMDQCSAHGGNSCQIKVWACE